VTRRAGRDAGECAVPLRKTVSAPRRRAVAFLVLPNPALLELAGPLHVFCGANNQDGVSAYTTIMLSLEGGRILSDTGVTLETRALSAVCLSSIDTLLVAGGHGAPAHAPDPRLFAWLRGASSRVRRIGAISAASVTLAQAGVLEGRRTAVDRHLCERFASAFPSIRVDPDAIYMRDDAVWTSAGVTGGIDLALAMVADDLGHDQALQVRRLLFATIKPAGAQFSADSEPPACGSCGRFDGLHQWIRTHLSHNLTVTRMAEVVAMSPRTFARRYQAETGRTPARAVEAMRLEAAACMLKEEALPIKDVARRTGFGDDERLRRAFFRRLGIAPQHYRERFRAPASQPQVGLQAIEDSHHRGDLDEWL
jgi:transcriptional regulator GlxA family with amidase domain